MMSQQLFVRQLTLGPMKNFIYLAGAPDVSLAFVVDPAWDAGAIFAALDEAGRELEAIVLTHSHFDHLNAVPDVLRRADVPVYVQRAEARFAPDAFADFKGALRPVEPGQTLRVAGLDVRCLHTPGHTPGAQCLHCGGALFSGDTLFVNACGRCDFEGSDVHAMHHSLFNVLGALSGDTTLYAGHDYGDVPVSSLARERAQNPYYQLGAVDDFVRFRMRPR